jgi:hypothetical protein
MTTIVTRAGKGAALTYAEMDANFTNLNNDKVEVAYLTATNTTNTPSGSIAATNVQAAVNELDTEKAQKGVNNDITDMYALNYPASPESPIRSTDLQTQAITKFTAGGTADALTGTINPEILSYEAGLRVTTKPVGTNTVTTPTLNLNLLGAKTIRKRTSSATPIALVAGDYTASGPFTFEYDGTYFILLDPLNPEQQLPAQTGFAGTALVTNGTSASWGSSINYGTPVTASGTAVDFTGIPTWAQRVIITVSQLSTNGTSLLLVQLGDSDGFETTGYTGCTQRGATFTAYTAGFILDNGGGAAYASRGRFVLELMNAPNNLWIFNGAIGITGAAFTANGTGEKSLTGVLNSIRITTVNGTDTFDSGTINIKWE